MATDVGCQVQTLLVRRCELSIEAGYLLHGIRIVIPLKLRQKLLKYYMLIKPACQKKLRQSAIFGGLVGMEKSNS